MNNTELVDAMDKVPMVEKWIKAVKTAVRELLEKDEDAMNGVYKLRRSGTTTTYTKEAVMALLNSEQMTLEELAPLLKINEGALAKAWSEKFGVTARDAKYQFRKALEECVQTKPKAMSIYKAKK